MQYNNWVFNSITFVEIWAEGWKYCNNFHNILRLFNVYQIFLSQVKRSAIISNKHGIYEFPHKLPNDFSQDYSQENLKTS